jgi:predicted outer membrane repeat protein
MTDNRPYKICFVFALILFLGLGLALVMPWLASSQSQAAQSDIEVLTSIIDLPERGNGIGVNAFPEARTNLVPTIVTRYYVATTGDGSDPTLGWTTAYTNVQDALAVAVETSEIWIAEGVYYPDEGSGQIDNVVTSTFFMTDGVALYGGFDTNDSDINDRDWENNVTVLSGDIDGDDTTDTNDVVTDTANINGNNAYHVVTGSGVTGTAVLDGFTITAGQANGKDAPDYSGGGFFCDGSGSGNNCSPSLTNVTFSGNWAHIYGGAMYNDGHDNGSSSPNLRDVTFTGNSAVYGGAMNNDGSSSGNSSPSLTNITFSGNSAVEDGGAMYNEGSSSGNSRPSLTNVTFSGNSAVEDGGAMYNFSYKGTSSPSLSNVTFSGNSAGEDGGAMYNDGSSNGSCNPEVSNSILWNNQDSSGTGTITATIYNLTATITLSYRPGPGNRRQRQLDVGLQLCERYGQYRRRPALHTGYRPVHSTHHHREPAPAIWFHGN